MSPKILLKVDGKYLAEYMLVELEKEHFTDVLFCLGHEAELVISEIKKISTTLNVEYFVENDRLGTLGALKQAESKLGDFFTIVMGDCFLAHTNLGEIHSLAVKVDAEAILLCKFTDHPDDSDLVKTDDWQRVLEIATPPHSPELATLSKGLAGVTVLKKSVINFQIKNKAEDLTRDLLHELVASGGRVQAIFHQGIIRDLGTPSRMQSFDLDSQPITGNDLVQDNVVLLDRDGTLNKLNGHITDYSKIEVLVSGQNLVDAINERNLNAFVITNQPVIARGGATMLQISEITFQLLAEMGLLSKIEDIFICPHYPESGFEDEVPELKIKCNCRKPNPGLILQAAKLNRFRCTRAIFFGDSITDMQAAISVGSRAVHLHKDKDASRCVVDSVFSELLICVSNCNSSQAFNFFGNNS
jgi:histidinol-phosphate phosphatase family protein